MSQAVSDCRACGPVKQLPSIQEIASASIGDVVGRIAKKINSYSLFGCLPTLVQLHFQLGQFAVRM
jgi:hypothetical protein